MSRGATIETPVGPRVGLITEFVRLGGSTTFLCNLAGELIRRKIPAQVLSFENDHPLESDFAALNIPVFLTDGNRSIYEDRLKSILDQLRAFRPTVVIASIGKMAYEVLRYVPPSVLRVGMIHTDEESVYAAIRPYGGCVDGMVAVSRVIQTRLGTMPEFHRVPIHYLPYGVVFPDSWSPNGTPGKALRILYLGRLEREQKRVHLFPQIFEELQRLGCPFEWTIAGDGPERAALERQMASPANQQKVSFPGKIDYREISRLLKSHDVYLLTSDYEGLPLSLLEAMGHGLVPVVSDLESGIRELVDEHTGKLVNPDAAENYARAIHWLHENRDAMRTLAQSGYSRVRAEYSLARMADRWLELMAGAAGHEATDAFERRVRPMLGHPSRLIFFEPLRTLRRLNKKLNGWRSRKHSTAL
jgi:glycosyltransferase involved in cell wall biosynthesis